MIPILLHLVKLSFATIDITFWNRYMLLLLQSVELLSNTITKYSNYEKHN